MAILKSQTSSRQRRLITQTSNKRNLRRKLFGLNVRNFKLMPTEDDVIYPLAALNYSYRNMLLVNLLTISVFSYLMLLMIIWLIDVIANSKNVYRTFIQDGVLTSQVIYQLSLFRTTLFKKKSLVMQSEESFVYFKPLSTASPELKLRMGKEAKILNRLLYFNVLLSIVTALFFYPIIGDETYVYFPMRFLKGFPKWCIMLNFIYFFIVVVIFLGIFMISHGWMLMYACYHARFQFYLMSEQVDQIAALQRNARKDRELRLNEDEEFQKAVGKILVETIRHLQNMKIYLRKTIRYTRYTMMFHSIGGIALVVVGLIFVLGKECPSSNFRIYLLLLSGIPAMLLYASAGQLLTNEAENFHQTLNACPYYLFNKANKVLYLNLLTSDIEPPILTCLGLVFVDFRLLIKIMKMTYSTLTFAVTFIRQ